MSGDIVERLRGPCVDWDGSQMPDAAEPLHMDCGTLREAATLIESLRSDNAAMREALVSIERGNYDGLEVTRHTAAECRIIANRTLSRIQERG